LILIFPDRVLTLIEQEIGIESGFITIARQAELPELQELPERAELIELNCLLVRRQGCYQLGRERF
jgi:hypothetical protein